MLSVALLLTLSSGFTACSSDDEDTKDNQSENNKGGNQNTGTANGHDYVDLGLPSGTKWATCNIGASKPEDFGDYYAWGETTTKSEFGWNTYKYGNSWDEAKNIGSNIAGTSYDVAHVKWGDDWRMPTFEQCKELISNTNSEWISQNGVNGWKFTSKNKKTSIFLPASGGQYPAYADGQGESGGTWTATISSEPDQAFALWGNSDKLYLNNNYDYRCNGHTVRPVIKK